MYDLEWRDVTTKTIHRYLWENSEKRTHESEGEKSMARVAMNR